MQADFIAVEDFLASLTHLDPFFSIIQSKEGKWVLTIIDIITNELSEELWKVIQEIWGDIMKLCPYCLEILSFYLEASIFALIIISHHFLVNAHY